MKEAQLRSAIVRWGRSLFERRLTSGSSGNISARTDDGFLCTPTNSCLGFLSEDRLSRLDAGGHHVDGDPPTKELALHFAYYAMRASANAVVHLHSSYATALSCLADLDPEDAIPVLTPYVVMRAGAIPLLPYTRPGSEETARLVGARAGRHWGVLLANHGPVVASVSLEGAVFAIEEVEEAAKICLLTRGLPVRRLSTQAVEDLQSAFPLPA